MKNMTVKCPEEVQRRFVAYCKLNGLTAQDVLVAFMKEKGDALAKYEDRSLLKGSGKAK
jgi:hypothetical protein